MVHEQLARSALLLAAVQTLGGWWAAADATRAAVHSGELNAALASLAGKTARATAQLGTTVEAGAARAGVPSAGAVSAVGMLVVAVQAATNAARDVMKAASAAGCPAPTLAAAAATPLAVSFAAAPFTAMGVRLPTTTTPAWDVIQGGLPAASHLLPPAP